MEDMSEELGEQTDFNFLFDPDKSNEENCQNIIEQFISLVEEIGEAAYPTGFDGAKLAASLIEAAEATADSFETQEKTVAIIGDQGTGKSTFINLLILLTELDDSQVRVLA